MSEYRTLAVLDNRICWRCGAKQGACRHTEGKRYDETLRVPAYAGRECTAQVRWTKDEERLAARLWKAGGTTGQIAELLNTSRSAVSGKLFRLGLMGERA